MSVPVLSRSLIEGRTAHQAETWGSEAMAIHEVLRTGPSSPRRTYSGPPVETVASCAKPDLPDPQSQSLSRSYGSNLPTSLTYIILSTRGFSPRRPAADMGTRWCDTAVSLSLIFKVPPGTRGHSENCCALRLDQNPFSLREDSRASVAYAEKTTLPRAPADVSDSFRVATSGTRARTVPLPG